VRRLAITLVAALALAGAGILAAGAADHRPARAAQHDHTDHDHGSSKGADPDAPPGAPASWLPNERWVMEHWLPYVERDLHRILGTDRNDVQAALRRGPLALLVEEKGLDLDEVIRELMRPARRQYPRNVKELTERARRTFTQPHLMQHMLFHPFHGPIQGFIQKRIGLPWSELHALRRQGMTLLEIAERQGIPRRRALRIFRKRLRWTARQAIRTRSSPRAEVGSWLLERYRRLPAFWDPEIRIGNTEFPVRPPRKLRLRP
jgi:hypothetical protein